MKWYWDGTARRDRGIKHTNYQAHGLEEYWIVDADESYVGPYHLVDSEYQLVLKSGQGHILNFAVSGLAILIPATFDEAVNMGTRATVLRMPG